ncbi:MAG: DUF4189 domain-containing protein [Hyphomicrobiaceae bacterium]|nr:MAG: DUF4189 domain-containing protein [Hyphomicrobiaceae bacterium]
MRWNLVVLATCLAVGLGGTRAEARDNYGAIAYSPSTGAHGWSYDYPSRSAAESTALRNCRRHASDCVVPIWFRNACGALAVAPGGGYGSGWGTSRSLAERYAMQSCRGHNNSGCSILRWACTTR